LATKPKALRKSPSIKKAGAKFFRAATAKSKAAKMNYLIDAAHEANWIDSWQDKMLHFCIEMIFGKGTPEQRLKSSAEKSARYKR
jgi:hypothetical protein